MRNYSAYIYGYQQTVPTQNGLRRYINFDNAASTPPFNRVMQRINEESLFYSAVHRGSGYKSEYSTELYETARATVAEFFHVDTSENAVIFTKNTTDSLNKLEYYLPYLSGKYVVFSAFEHHSNELPWQKHPYLRLSLDNGQIDLNKLEEIFRKNRNKIKLLAISGASNVTGYTPPINEIAEIVHHYGSKIVVDGAQLVPHRKITFNSEKSAQNPDFLAFSGHKVYAPFGSGVLIGPKSLFKNGMPSQLGGGTLSGFSRQGILWNEPPFNEEAGSPNVLGAVAIEESLLTIDEIGMHNIIHLEEKLTNYTLQELKKIPRITVYEAPKGQRVGVIAFNVIGRHHSKVADYLSKNMAIGVRSGCFCARRYVADLLQLDYQTFNSISNPQNPPGMVRISFGCYNSLSEIDVLLECLRNLV